MVLKTGLFVIIFFNFAQSHRLCAAGVSGWRIFNSWDAWNWNPIDNGDPKDQ